MQIQAINSYHTTNFYGNQNPVKYDDKQEHVVHNPIKKLAGPAIAAMFLVPVAVTNSSCAKIDVEAKAEAKINVIPVKNDTIEVHDTIYIPTQKDFNFPVEIEDSLNVWRGDVLKIPAEGDDGTDKGKAVLWVSGFRDWELNRPEYAVIDIAKSDSTRACYNRTIADSIKTDVEITKVEPGDLTIVKKDGTVTNQVGGLLFNEDGVKTFAHSKNGDKIIVYKKANDGAYVGKYVEAFSIHPGFLPKEEYGENVLLNGAIGEGWKDHYTHVKSGVMNIEDIEEETKPRAIIN